MYGARIYGNDGDDTLRRSASLEEIAYGGVVPNYGEYLFGGAGDDIIEGTHDPDEWSWMYGGSGNDKIYGGDGNPDIGITGGDGDDWIENGDFGGDEYIYGDSPDMYNDWDYIVEYGETNPRYMETDSGDDVIYGGDNHYGDSYIHGGYGDDKLIGGHGLTGSYARIYGDNG